MNITKLGHCCLKIVYNNITFLTDPGSWTEYPEDLFGIDYILITHEHGDHFHVPAVKDLMEKNPHAKIICNKSVGKLVTEAGFSFTEISDGMLFDLNGISLEGFGTRHGEIWNEIGQVENTGFFLDNKFFYPGDNFTNPNRAVDILAAPVAGPWMKFKDALAYILEIKPRVAVPVHDGMLTSGREGPLYLITPKVLEEHGISFSKLTIGEQADL